MFKAVLATQNKNKAKEIIQILTEIEFLPRPSDFPDIEESGSTIEENAILKAVTIAEHAKIPSLADDTGLEVEELNFTPGVHSARFAGEGSSDLDNVNKVLSLMENKSNRTAMFKTVIAMAFPDGKLIVGKGEVKGSLTSQIRGTNGFGYDAIFIPQTGDGRTFGQMSSEEKNSMSHRKLALIDFKSKFEQFIKQ
jgi:XTP/dITP diphosphohydrolase